MNLMLTIILLLIVALCGFDLMSNQYQQGEPYTFLFWGAIVLALAGWVVIDSTLMIVGNIRDIVAKGKAYESTLKVSIPPAPNQVKAPAPTVGVVERSKPL